MPPSTGKVWYDPRIIPTRIESLLQRQFLSPESFEYSTSLCLDHTPPVERGTPDGLFRKNSRQHPSLKDDQSDLPQTH